MNVLAMCRSLYHMYMPIVHRVQKRESDHLELDLYKTVSHGVGAGNQTSVLWKNVQCLTTEHLHSP